MSSKAEFLQASRFKTEIVTLANGLTGKLREFSAATRDDYEQSMVKVVDGKRAADLTNMRAKLVAMCLVDEETDEPMFTAEELGAMPASYIEPLFEAARQLNGMGADQVDTAAKNSESAPSGASTSV